MGWGRNKYRAKAAKSLDGRSFHSQGERDCYHYLLAKEQAGEIRDLKCQCRVFLSEARIEYHPDFSYVDIQTNHTIFVEYKGYETPEWRIKRRLWVYYGPNTLLIYKGYGGSLKLHETIVPKCSITHTNDESGVSKL